MNKKKKWVIKEPLKPEIHSQFPGYHPLVLQLLMNRGLKNQQDFNQYLNPRYESLSDPFTFPGMKTAVTHLWSAFSKQEKITIYADYDADAVTACALLHIVLKKIGFKNVDFYIPDRFSEGYGLNTEAMQKICDKGTNLLITADCGINSREEIAFANKRGVDTIVTDHHEIIGDLPAAVAIVNPKLKAADLSVQGLTGVGVTFKVAQALIASLYPGDYEKKFLWTIPDFKNLPSPKPEINSNWEKWLLDLVAIGTIADCQDLMGENRVLVSYGLKVMPKTRWLGLAEMIKNAGLRDGKIDTFTIGFIIAPRINAAGRIQHADVALRLLISQDGEEASQYAGQLESLNQHRQRLTEQIFSEAQSQVELQGDRKILLAAGENWPRGVVGLVASRLTDFYSRPSVVLDKGETHSVGSARSIRSLNLIQAFAYASAHLVKYGGHAGAAGITIKTENIEKFHQSLTEFADNNILEEDLIMEEPIDAEINLSDLSDELMQDLKKFEPFGQGNPEIKFLIKGIVLENIKTVGASGKHIKLLGSQNGKIAHFIGFNQSKRLPILSIGSTIDVIVQPSENQWNGKTELQLKIIDLKMSS